MDLNKKTVYLLMGSGMIILGVFSFLYSEFTALLCGFAAIAYGAGELMQWRERRRIGATGIWSKLSILTSIAFGAFVIAGHWFALFAIRFALICVALWLTAEGILQIIGAVMYRKAMTTADLGVQAPGSISSMVCGIIMIVIGLIAVIFPVFAEYTAWLCVSAGLIIAGIRVFWMARHAGEFEKKDEKDT